MFQVLHERAECVRVHSIGHNCTYVHLCECGCAAFKCASAFMYNFSVYSVTDVQFGRRFL